MMYGLMTDDGIYASVLTISMQVEYSPLMQSPGLNLTDHQRLEEEPLYARRRRVAFGARMSAPSYNSYRGEETR